MVKEARGREEEVEEEIVDHRLTDKNVYFKYYESLRIQFIDIHIF